MPEKTFSAGKKTLWVLWYTAENLIGLTSNISFLFMPDYHMPFLPGEKYHIFSRAVGDEKLFRQEINYAFFLSRYQKYISPVADTYCYSLLPNHFHSLLKIKDEESICSYFQEAKVKPYSSEMAPRFIMQHFSNLLNSYAKSYNGLYSRKGGLFIDYLRRVEIKNDSQFGATIFYIHKNPVHHGYCRKMDQWEWSSYNTMFSDKPSKLLHNEVLDWFGGIKGFLDYHNQPVYLKNAVELE